MDMVFMEWPNNALIQAAYIEDNVKMSAGIFNSAHDA